MEEGRHVSVPPGRHGNGYVLLRRAMRQFLSSFQRIFESPQCARHGSKERISLKLVSTKF